MRRILLVLLLILTSEATAYADPKVAYGFTLPGCSACRRMYPIWGRMGIKIVDCSTSDWDEKWGVTVAPTTVIVQDGKVVKVLPGVVSADEIRQYLR